MCKCANQAAATTNARDALDCLVWRQSGSKGPRKASQGLEKASEALPQRRTRLQLLRDAIDCHYAVPSTKRMNSLVQRLLPRFCASRTHFTLVSCICHCKCHCTCFAYATASAFTLAKCAVQSEATCSATSIRAANNQATFTRATFTLLSRSLSHNSAYLFEQARDYQLALLLESGCVRQRRISLPIVDETCLRHTFDR